MKDRDTSWPLRKQSSTPNKVRLSHSCPLPVASRPEYPEFADGVARLDQRHPPFLRQDLLDGLQDPRGHGDVPANVDVALALAQDFEDVVRQV